MKKFISMFTLVCLLAPGAALAETAKKDATPAADPHMEAYIKASTPGAEHKLLERYVGKWDHTVSWWQKPDTAPEVSKGSTVIESIFGGRFIRQTATGTAMGQPFEGLGITGYDNVQKHFTSIWLDNMGTTIMSGTGKLDTAKDAIVDHGSFSCPLSKTGKRDYRAVWSPPVNDSFTYEFFSNAEDGGKEFRMMQIVYTKAK